MVKISVSGDVPIATSGPFDHTRPISEDNPLPVAISPEAFSVGEVLSETNRLPVIILADEDEDPIFKVGEPISIANPLPVSSGSARKAVWRLGEAVLANRPLPVVVVGGDPERPFTAPNIDDFDLLYYLPGYSTQDVTSSTTPTVGSAFSISGTEYQKIEQYQYTVRAKSNWTTDNVAYIFADLAEQPGELVCYFKTGASLSGAILPTMATLSDTSGAIPFWHLRMANEWSTWDPDRSYQAPPLISENLNYITLTTYSLSPNTWYVARVQIRNKYEGRLTVETTGGSVISTFYAFDGELPRLIGLKAFWELFGKGANDFVYGFLGAKSVANTNYSGWGTTGFVAGASMLTSPGASWTDSLFNAIYGDGSQAWDSTNKEWDITAHNYGPGGAYAIGAVTSGDVIDVYGDVTSLSATAGVFEIAAVYSVGVCSNETYVGATGAFHKQLTINSTQPSAQIIFGGAPTETNLAVSLKNILILKNKIALADYSASDPA